MLINLINHPTDGATRGLTLSVCLLGRDLKKNNNTYCLCYCTEHYKSFEMVTFLLESTLVEMQIQMLQCTAESIP